MQRSRQRAAATRIARIIVAKFRHRKLVRDLERQRHERHKESTERLLMYEEEQYERHRVATIKRFEAIVAQRETSDMMAEEEFERRRLAAIRKNAAQRTIALWLYGCRLIATAKLVLGTKRKRLRCAKLIQHHYRRHRTVVAAKQTLARLRRDRDVKVLSLFKCISLKGSCFRHSRSGTNASTFCCHRLPPSSSGAGGHGS
jgi:hypothetical protein